MMRRRPALAWLAGACLGQPLVARAADELSEREVRNVRQVVEAQLRAMAEGDGDKAFFYAAPAIRAQFGSAARFMAMVLGTYPMLVRPLSTVFFRATPGDDGQALQVVQLRDREGRLWRASYLLMRRPDGPWRIAGCLVAPDSSSNAT
ncbi:MAG: DUF4864 domain-containing protein [Pseudomonadota bacterium]